MKNFLLFFGLFLLFAFEILRVYFIMPFPGSQQNETLGFAYWLDKNIGWIHILLLALVAYPVVSVFLYAKFWKKALLASALLFFGVIYYFFNFKFQADKMFYQPGNKSFSVQSGNKIPDAKLILGVTINGEAKAYPIQLIGYHHQVRDTVGGVPVMATYCTVCRTGRVFSPVVDGKNEIFRLVGMDHFNAMFEDASTKSWWRQATGEAVAGPLKGKILAEIPSRQVTLEAWLQLYPNSGILQPDTFFKRQYKSLASYDNGTIDGKLEKRDSASWKFKSWIVGVTRGGEAKAYDWNDLTNAHFIQDSLAGTPILVALENDTASFHVWNRDVNGKRLKFVKSVDPDQLTDVDTKSTWSKNGLCVAGPLKGVQLEPIQAYQEFWHSWSTFHPNTLRYQP